MKPTRLLLTSVLILFSFSFNAFAQSLRIVTTTKSINEYLIENNKKIDEIQVVILQENQGKATFSSGEALGIKKNNSNEVVIFVSSQTIDPLKIKFSEENDIPFPLLGSITTMEIKKDNTLHLFYSNANFSIKF
jgi:hypothetical protein